MAHGDAREGKWRGNWRMEWVASTLHTTSEHGVSSIIATDAHTSAASIRLNWPPCWFKWTCPFHRKTKSGFCVCAITFQMQSTTSYNTDILTYIFLPLLQDYFTKHLLTHFCFRIVLSSIYLFICVCCTIVSPTSCLFISVLQDKQQQSTYFSFCCRVISHSISFLYGAYAFRGKDCSLRMFRLC
jgi:hypothetical protein